MTEKTHEEIVLEARKSLLKYSQQIVVEALYEWGDLMAKKVCGQAQNITFKELTQFTIELVYLMAKNVIMEHEIKEAENATTARDNREA